MNVLAWQCPLSKPHISGYCSTLKNQIEIIFCSTEVKTHYKWVGNTQAVHCCPPPPRPAKSRIEKLKLSLRKKQPTLFVPVKLFLGRMQIFENDSKEISDCMVCRMHQVVPLQPFSWRLQCYLYLLWQKSLSLVQRTVKQFFTTKSRKKFDQKTHFLYKLYHPKRLILKILNL